MSIKAKHEEKIFAQIYENFTYGKPINDLRQDLIDLDENQEFGGGPTCPFYQRKIRKIAKEEHEKIDRFDFVHPHPTSSNSTKVYGQKKDTGKTGVNKLSYMKNALLDKFPALKKTSTRHLIRDGEASGVRMVKFYSPKAPDESETTK